jgi:predicted alpha/beta superfamily hydrolase
MGWERYRAAAVVGDVRLFRGGSRHLFAYLPPSHGSGRRFPVVYMHDAQNLFDEATSESGEWRADETMEELALEGLEAIVVGIPHAGERRGKEYAGPDASAYLSFLADTVRQLVNESFDVDERREATGVVGSSLGGLISLQGVYEHRDVFSFAGVFSPAFWWNDDASFELVEREEPPDARIYLDVGGDEWNDGEDTRHAYVDGFERMSALLRRKGFDERALKTVFDPGGVHHETAWSRRLPDALRFLLPR